MILAASSRTTRVTPDEAHEEALRGMEQRIRYYAVHQDLIPQRLQALDEEWDVDRVLSAGISGLGLLGVVLAVVRRRRRFLLPALVSGLVLQYAVQGRSPLVPLLRQLGIRTRAEVEEERYALKVLRGDFKLGDLEGKSEMERVSAILSSILLR